MRLILSLMLLITRQVGATAQSTDPLPNPVRFSYATGNHTVAPKYQHETSVTGTLEKNAIRVTYSERYVQNKEKKPVEWSGTLRGADYRKVAGIVRQTSIAPPPKPKTGASYIRMQVVDRSGMSISGVPKNAESWAALLALVRSKAGQNHR